MNYLVHAKEKHRISCPFTGRYGENQLIFIDFHCQSTINVTESLHKALNVLIFSEILAMKTANSSD